MTASRVALALLATAFIGLPARADVANAHAQPAPVVSLSLIDQTLYVPPNGSFQLSLQFSGALPAGTRLFVEVYPQLEGGRAVFDRALAGEFDTGTVPPGPLNYPLDGEQYAPDASGRLDLDVTTVVTREDERVGRVRLAVAGVYPVRVAVRDDTNNTLTELVTFVVRLPDEAIEGQLATAVIVPLDAPPAVPAQPELPRPLDDASRARWEAILAVLEATPTVPLTVVPRPEAVAALRRTDATLADRLSAALAGRQITAPPFVEVDAGGLVAAGLAGELTEQLVRGDNALATNLPGVRPDRRTWSVTPTLTAAAADHLQTLGVDQWIVPAAALGPAPGAEPASGADPAEAEVDPMATHTSEVSGDGFTLAAAAVPDVELSAALAGSGGRGAARLLEAELAFIWFQAPENERDGRGVVLEMPADWTPEPDLVNGFLGQLEASPVLEPVTVDDYFSSVPRLSGADGAPVVRTLPPQPAPDLALLAEDLRRAQSELATLSGYVIDATEPTLLNDGLHVAASADLDSAARQPYISRITERVDVLKEAVAPIESETFTLTSRRAVLTVTLQNRLPQDVQVRVQLSSSKLKIDKPNQVVVLSADAAEPVDFQVEALSTGAFPLAVEVRSPDRAILMRTSTWTVRSTAVSGVGWMLSIGGLVFLAGWWVTHARRVRRAKRLEAAESGAAKARLIVGTDTTDGPGPT